MEKAICDRCSNSVHNIDMHPFRRSVIKLPSGLKIMMETTIYEDFHKRAPVMGGKLHFCFGCGEWLIQEHIRQLDVSEPLWISVEDDLPDNNTEVWVVGAIRQPVMGWIVGQSWFNKAGERAIDVTHWMERRVPSPPEVKKIRLK